MTRRDQALASVLGQGTVVRAAALVRLCQHIEAPTKIAALPESITGGGGGGRIAGRAAPCLLPRSPPPRPPTATQHRQRGGAGRGCAGLEEGDLEVAAGDAGPERAVEQAHGVAARLRHREHRARLAAPPPPEWSVNCISNYY